VGRIGRPWLERVGGIGSWADSPARSVSRCPGNSSSFRPLPADAQADKTHWTRSEAAQLVAALHGHGDLGSPLASINELGPAVVLFRLLQQRGVVARASNSRLARTSPRIAHLRGLARGGFGRARRGAVAPGRPARRIGVRAGALRSSRTAAEGGYVIWTGATTVIRAICIGQSACVRFDGVAELLCKSVPAVTAIRTKRTHASHAFRCA
jgi:2-keto-4-pentenoate hydratase